MLYSFPNIILKISNCISSLSFSFAEFKGIAKQTTVFWPYNRYLLPGVMEM